MDDGVILTCQLDPHAARTVSRWVLDLYTTASEPAEILSALNAREAQVASDRDALLQLAHEAQVLGDACDLEATQAESQRRVHGFSEMRSQLHGMEAQCLESAQQQQDLLDAFAAARPGVERAVAQLEAMRSRRRRHHWQAMRRVLQVAKTWRPQQLPFPPRKHRRFGTARARWLRQRPRRRLRIIVQPPAIVVADPVKIERVTVEAIESIRMELAELRRQPVAQDEPFLTVAQAATLAAVHASTIRKWVRARHLGRYPPEGRVYRIRRDELEVFLASGGGPAAAAPVTDVAIEQRARQILAEDRSQ